MSARLGDVLLTDRDGPCADRMILCPEVFRGSRGSASVPVTCHVTPGPDRSQYPASNKRNCPGLNPAQWYLLSVSEASGVVADSVPLVALS
eukprot:3858057-Rhodomonas_salina.2